MPGQDKRRSQRFAPPRPLRARFLVQGQQVDAEIASLGAGGVGAWAEDRFAFLFDPGSQIQELSFDDPLLPTPPAEATIAYATLKGESAREGWVLFGAEFHPTDTEYLQAMAAWMERAGPR